jgi:hypothetical protein
MDSTSVALLRRLATMARPASQHLRVGVSHLQTADVRADHHQVFNFLVFR